jgi:hypothetical protein
MHARCPTHFFSLSLFFVVIIITTITIKIDCAKTFLSNINCVNWSKKPDSSLISSYFIHGSFWLEWKEKKRDDYHCNCIEREKKSKSTRKLQVTQREETERFINSNSDQEGHVIISIFFDVLFFSLYQSQHHICRH